MQNCTGELIACHFIINQGLSFGKVINMEDAMNTIVQTVNFFRAKGLAPISVLFFLQEIDSEFGNMPYHAEVRWLSRAKILRRFYQLIEGICPFKGQ